MDLIKEFYKEQSALSKQMEYNVGKDGVKTFFKWFEKKLETNQLQTPDIIKLAEKRIDKLWKDKIPYVNDECDDIVEDIENEIEQLKKLVDGLKYYQENINKFSE